MYNKKYWNETVQLVFSYTYITFWLVQCFLFYTTYEMVPQQQIAWQGLDFFLTAKNIARETLCCLTVICKSFSMLYI